MMSLPALMRDPAGRLPNSAILLYTLVGYAAGISLLTRSSTGLFVLGVLLLAHTLVCSAYLVHELAHFSIFRRQALNDTWGRVMTWLNGGCYVPFDDIRNKHLRHHADRVDVVTFDYRAYLHRHPLLCRVVLALEWLYVPAVEILMHGFVIALPFVSPDPHHRNQRLRLLGVLAVRVLVFTALGAAAPQALAGYALAWLLFVTVLRFNDAFQHTYPVVPLLSPGARPDQPKPSKEFEQQNTYSNLVSLRHPWLNGLLLNFTFHNAHHERPSVPWYRLPALHRELYATHAMSQVLPWRSLLGTFHRNRVRRVLADDYGAVTAGPAKADGFVGAVGVSFLTAV